MDYKRIGETILELRKKQGYTQSELAFKLNVSDKAVSKWERGLGLPDISILSTLAMVLDSDVEQILEGNANATVKDKWLGLLNLSESKVPIDSLIYDKELLVYQIGYFLLAGIKDIYIYCKECDKKNIARITKRININTIFIDAINNLYGNNIMYIEKPLFIYGQNLTRSFQKAAERTCGITVLSLPEHINSNEHILFDSNHKVIEDTDKAIETAYKYNRIPIYFYPKQYSDTLSIECKENKLMIIDDLYVEPMFRGMIYIPINNKEDILDASKIVEIIQKRDYPISNIEEICNKRGLI